ncbi:MAG: DinB family protein [Anaerolineales bacterium]|nr:DinB family protein [Anaerolineales bacterium]
MPHPKVIQLRFTRSEFQRGLAGVTAEDALQRLEPMNSISWIIGHLAAQEQRFWLTRAQGKTPFPGLDAIAGFGSPPSTPPLEEMWAQWRAITAEADRYLEGMTIEKFLAPMNPGSGGEPNAGTNLQRSIYHYWFHLGECLAIRQMLGHKNLPEFVGDLQGKAPYRPE